MNREIKFRGIKSNKDGSKGEFVYGFYCVSHERPGRSEHWILCEETGTRFLIYSETLGQYTGLKDKNGKEIYEGDIVKTDVGLCEIEWIGGGLSLHTLTRESSRSIFSIVYHECEIIGNIYENPELLNK